MQLLNGDTEGTTIQDDIWDTMNELVFSAGLAITSNTLQEGAEGFVKGLFRLMCCLLQCWPG